MSWQAGNRCAIYSQLISPSRSVSLSVVLPPPSVWQTRVSAHAHAALSVGRSVAHCVSVVATIANSVIVLSEDKHAPLNLSDFFFFFFPLAVCWGRAEKISIIYTTKQLLLSSNLIPSLLAVVYSHQPPDNLPSAAVIFSLPEKIARREKSPRFPRKRKNRSGWECSDGKSGIMREIERLYTPLISRGLHKFKDGFNLADKDERMRQRGKGEMVRLPTS